MGSTGEEIISTPIGDAPALLVELHRSRGGRLEVARAAGGGWLAGRGFEPTALRDDPTRLLEWIEPRDREALEMALAGLPVGAPPSWLPLRLTSPDAGTCWVGSTWVARPEGADGARISGVLFDWSAGHAEEERLRRSEELHRELLENAHDLIYTHDLQGKFTAVNRAAERLTGYTREEILGMPISQVIAAEYLEEARSNIVRKLENPDLVTYYGLEIVAKDGRRISLEVSTRILWEDGKPVGIQGIARDLTERMRAEEQIARTAAELQNIMATVPDPVYMIDMQGRLTRWNRNVEKVTGLTAEELEGRHAFDFFPPEDRPLIAQAIERAVREGPSRVEARLLQRDGTAVPYEFYGAALRDASGEIVGVTGVARDVSARKRDQEIQALQAAELKRSNQELQDFAHIVSHDLKAPLRGIHSYATFLLEDYHDKLDEEGKEQLETLRRLPVRMEELINTLLQYSRIGGSDASPVKTDLDALVRTVLDDLEAELREQRVEVKVPKRLPAVVCDRVRIAMVFRNLVSNAIKYNDKTERIVEIGWDLAEAPDAGGRQERRPVFYVRDNGIGIREKDRDAVFRIFRRLHGRTEYGGGHGAGLSIVKKIVEQHGGRVWVESELGEGTTMRFTLGTALGTPGGPPTKS